MSSVPTSGPLSLSTIASVFGGGVGPFSLSMFYAGGSRVPAGTSGISGPIPSSGPLSFSVFRGATAVQTLTISLAGGFPLSTLGVGFSATPSISGGQSPFTFSVVGSLPAGVSINSTTGAISGTPTGGPFTNIPITIRVTDGRSVSADVTDTIVHRDFPWVSLSLPPAMRTRPYFAMASWSQGANFHNPSISMVGGSVPPGISFSNGTFSGTPTGTTFSETFSLIRVRVGDAAGNAAQADSMIAYADNLVIIGSLPSAQVGVPYNASLSTSGGFGSNFWIIAAGGLPAGLTMTNAGVISGTPTTSGNFNLTLRATDAQNFAAESPQSISVAAAVPPLVVSGTLPSAQVGVAYSGSLSASGGTPPYTWSVVAGGLPAGLSLNASNGVISGTPTTSGNFNLTLRATDAASRIADSAQSISVAAAVQPLSVTAGNITATVTNNPAGDQVTFVDGYSTAVATGGTSPYTFSWTRVAGSASGSPIAYDGMSTYTLTATRTDVPGTSTETMRVTVTDSAFNTATVDIHVWLELLNGDIL